MNHPTKEQWMDYLYKEADPTESRKLAAHLQTCADCRQETQKWGRGMESLDQWRLEAPQKSAAKYPVWGKWAAAAALFLLVGFLAGRVGGASSSSLDPAAQALLVTKVQESARAEIHAALAQAKAENKKEMDELALALTQALSESKTVFTSLLQKMETERVNDLTNLRKELETVALYTDQSLRRAQAQLVHLAGYSSNVDQ